MKKFFISILLLLIFVQGVYANDGRENPFQPHNDNYFICGDKTDDQVKYQVSLKYALLYPFNIGLYAAYTQTSLWNIFDKSSPFIDSNYNPEVFWEFTSGNNLFGNVTTGVLDYIRIGFYEHKSNGRDGEESRGWDRCYIKTQLSVGQTVNVGISLKVWYLYNTASRNSDIYEYMGAGEGELFIKLRNERGFLDHEKLYVRGGVGGTYFGREVRENENHWGWNSDKYWIESGLEVRIFSARVQPHLYIQYYYGQNQFLLTYNELTEHAVRVGVILR
jgi:outer membrane phospholipase A